MKETRFFYVPDATETTLLPDEEALHALKVLRLSTGDDIVLIDGCGHFYDAEVTATDKRHCHYSIKQVLPQERLWMPHLHIAVAPTKNIDRIEWFVEKAVEIGVDEITFLNCQFSERRNIRIDRIEKIVVAAMKQSRKAWKTQVNEMEDFDSFLSRVNDDNVDRFICHCYNEADISVAKQNAQINQNNATSVPEKPLLRDLMAKGRDTVVMVGPEGDFSIDEVVRAEAEGSRPVSLGDSRLRTETAALVAVHLMRLFA